MYKTDIILKNESGFHARPASLFVAISSKFSSDIRIIKDGKEYNGKSIIGILSIGAGQGSLISIVAEGRDERQAVDDLIKLIENNFSE